ncbi:hypothetical protein FZEAL_5319 [Fusarium zealandicum]|uniref:Uncharacterized protein n=1 Tax=Fusarium zealandicum TaxID=1053134 RepID=A0A8H4UKT9_9HYPO|nr:hypothetical protein FZEAL_5319 [Fusarium zealandicum]
MSSEDELSDDNSFGYDSSDDDSSVKSYNGPDADNYYYLKELRLDRKLELAKTWGQSQPSIREEDIYDVRCTQSVVKGVLESLKKKEMKKGAAGAKMNLVKLNGTVTFEMVYADGTTASDDEEDGDEEDDDEEDNLYNDSGECDDDWDDTKHLSCCIRLGAAAEYSFDMPDPPTEVSSKRVTYLSNDKKYEFQFQFLGRCLTLRVSRNWIFRDRKQPANAPEFFEFAGLWYDFDVDIDT